METTIQAKIENGMIFSEYASSLVDNFRRNGGRWDSEKKGWQFSAEQGAAIFDELFGNGDVVSVTVPKSKTSDPSDGFAMIGGYVLAVRKSRDYSPRLGTGVSLVSGHFPGSAGSMKHPAVDASDDTVYRLNVYRSFAEKNGLQIEEKTVQSEVESPLAKIADETLIAELSKRGYKITR